MAYCGYVVTIKELRPHSNADRLQIATIFGNDVIVDLNTQKGHQGVYFPVDGQLSPEFCAANDLVRRKDENGNQCGGYLDPEKRNIKALKLRGEKSDGLFLPITCLAAFTTISDLKDGDTITILNGVEICKKYIPQRRVSGQHGGGVIHRAKANIAPTFYEHVETQQLAYNLEAFKSGDVVELTLKMHGTSGRTGHLPLVHEKKRTLFHKLFHKHPGTYTEYGYITGTRRVVLDGKHTAGFYNDNEFREAMAAKFEGKLHKGEVAYYEIVGFVNESSPIMASCDNKKIKDKEFEKQYGPVTTFSYGCDPNGGFEYLTECEWDIDGNIVPEEERAVLAPRCEVYVYRMTQVNEDGDVVELSPEQMRLRCEQMGINTVPVFEKFMIPNFDVDVDGDGTADAQIMSPGEYVLRKVEQYFDGPDPVGKTHIREGVVARIVNRPEIAVYKHKNFNFKLLSGIAIEQAVENGSIENMSEDILSEL